MKSIAILFMYICQLAWASDGEYFEYAGRGKLEVSLIPGVVFSCDDFTINQSAAENRQMMLEIHYRCTSPEFAYPVVNDENIFYRWNELNQLLFDDKPIGYIKFRADGSLAELFTKEEGGPKFHLKRNGGVLRASYNYQNSYGDYNRYEAALDLQ